MVSYTAQSPVLVAHCVSLRPVADLAKLSCTQQPRTFTMLFQPPASQSHSHVHTLNGLATVPGMVHHPVKILSLNGARYGNKESAAHSPVMLTVSDVAFLPRIVGHSTHPIGAGWLKPSSCKCKGRGKPLKFGGTIVELPLPTEPLIYRSSSHQDWREPPSRYHVPGRSFSQSALRLVSGGLPVKVVTLCIKSHLKSVDEALHRPLVQILGWRSHITAPGSNAVIRNGKAKRLGISVLRLTATYHHAVILLVGRHIHIVGRVLGSVNPEQNLDGINLENCPQ